jgi:hypothetical protein
LKSLQSVLVAVAKDLGDTDSLDSIELVDFKQGSTALVFEQPRYDDRPTILETTFAAMNARAKALPLPAILTDKSLRTFDDFQSYCTLLALRGIPVFTESEPDIANDTETEPVRIAIGIIAPSPTDIERPGVEEERSSAGESEEQLSSADYEPHWKVRFSGTIQRLDEHERKMWVKPDDSSQLFSAKLTPEQFSEVDSDKLRWQHIVGVGHATAQSLSRIREVLDLEPTTECVETSFTAITQGAEGLGGIVAKIQSFQKLTEGWDSYDGKPIPGTAILAAITFLSSAAQKLAKKDIRLLVPFAAPLSFGGLQLEWSVGSRYLEIEFHDMKDVCCLRGTEEFEVESTESRGRALELVEWLHAAEKP